MAKCVVCGKPVGKGIKYCASCGTSGAGRARQSAGGSYGVLSTVDWLVTMIVIAIPLVGLVMIFVWAFGSGNPNRRNFCRAGLILMAVSIVLGIISYFTMSSFLGNILGPLMYGIF